MSEKELMPRCPYCGATMEENLYAYKNGGGWCNFECPNCGAMSPKKENSESCNKAELAAYFVAKKRYEEPNRVLTPTELKSYTGFIWCESRDGEVFEPGWVEYMYAYGRGCETINLCDENIDWTQGRCWLRKPTLEEMAKTPWGDKDEQ